MTFPVTFESRTFKIDEAPARARAAAEAALDLTASDGTGLVLVSLTARVVVEDPLAFTELHLVFQNPEPRQLEGRFRIGLPSGASVSRFAMRIGTTWQEGEVVERQAARRAYEDFLHRRQDPALLEHEAGNEFSARVFPIEANSRKEILVSYGHELTGEGDVYRLPLIGLPEVQELSIRALVGRAGAREAASSSLGGTSASWQVVEVQKARWRPDLDFEVRPAPSGRAGLRHKNLAVVRVQPELPAEPDEIGSLLLLLDTSASRALGFDRQVELAGEIVRGIARSERPRAPVAIACFDQGIDMVFEGTASDFGAADTARLSARLALGASDLAAALRWAAARTGTRYERLLLVTDGVATAGETEADKIVLAARELAGAGVKRLDVLAVGGLRDDASLRRLVTAGLDRDGTVCDGDLPLAEIGRKLLGATRSGIAVEVPGASWVWPSRLDGVQPGDSALVYADVPPEKPVRVLLDGEPVGGGDLALEPVERPLLARAWVKARIERLEEIRSQPGTDPDIRAGLQKQIIDLSVKNRVLSPYTALLVLETEADYERFQIDRNALSDILTVGLSGVEVLHRTAASVPVAAAPPPAKAAPTPSLKKAKARPPAEMAFPEGGPEQERAPEVDALRSLSPMQDEAAEPAAEEEEESTLVPQRLESRAPDISDEGDTGTRTGTLGRSSPERFEADGLVHSPGLAMDMLEEGSLSSDEADMPLARAAAPSPMRDERPAPMPAPAAARPAAFSPSPPRAESPSPLRRLANAVTDAVSSLRERVSPGAPPADPPAPPPPPPPPQPQGFPATPPVPEQPSVLESWTGTFRDVMALVLAGEGQKALDLALSWRKTAPGDVLALIGIGEAAELLGAPGLAARAYGSILDLFPSRADLRRFAGERLSRLAQRAALDLAIDTYRKAVESRPDHPSGHRLLGMALLRAGRFAEAFEAIAAGQARSYPNKFPGIPRILTEDLGLAAAAWLRAEPAREGEILARLRSAGATLEISPSVRFVLVWETDANDVDFHIHDAAGGHAYFREKVLPSGGELYADVTQGYGPECFTIRGAPPSRAYPYRLQAHYYRQGPMGYGMGALQTVEHDGKGGFAFAERPYVVMKDGAFVDLGVVTGPLAPG